MEELSLILQMYQLQKITGKTLEKYSALKTSEEEYSCTVTCTPKLEI